MELRREPLLFGVTLLVVGALAWHGRGEERRRGVPSARQLEPAQIALPPVIALVPAVDGAVAGRDGPDGAADLRRARGRSLFAPPRELLPLDPVALPAPPWPRLSVLRPTTDPGPRGAAARADRVPPDELGRLALGDDALGESPLGDDLLGDEIGRAAGEPDLDEPALEERFDWFVRAGAAGQRIYGVIQNDDPHGLVDRPGEALGFQQVSERTGRPVGVPFEVPRAEVDGFGLARTFENDYRARTRRIPEGPGSVGARRELAAELLEAWPREPAALELALGEARRAWDAGPGQVETAELLASIHAARHDVEGALAVYHAAVEGGFADAALLAGYAELVRGLGLEERAWELVAQARRQSRVAADVSYVEGLLLRDAGRDAEALAVLRAATTQPWERRDVRAARRRLALAFGAALLAQGQGAAALREADRLLLDDPDDAEAHDLRGAALLAGGDAPGAVAALGQALALDPDDGRVLTNAALATWRSGDGPGAVRLLERAREVDPYRAVRATLALGFLYEDAGQPERARELYAQALELEPGHPVALYRMGRNQRRDGDAQGATETLRRALELAGPDVLVLLELGRAAVDRGRADEARRYVREAERLEPDNGEVQWALGLAALAAGDLFAVDEPLQRAVAAGAGGAHVGLAVAAYRRGEVEAALDHFDEVARAYAGRPDDPQAVYAAEQVARIADNLAKRQWIERFDRSTLQRGWSEHAWDGAPRVRLAEGGLAVVGRMEKPRDDERPGISRLVEGRAFDSVQVELSAGEGGETRCGIALTHRALRGSLGRTPKARLELLVDTDGTVRASVLDSFDRWLLTGEALGGRRVAPGSAVRLGIERLDDVAGTFRFTVDGQPVGEPVECKSLRSFRDDFELEVFAEAPPGRGADGRFHLVRIVRAP